ncbi:serine/threonine-protein kinase [Nannocystis pusilla]|uniref:serine/threonine-protein kinase n=1 Tax=Nannocystis pusilla TaxID=889268 RepID=UPI003B79E555
MLQVLGRGGMGSVYLAEHVEVGRKVAIKVLLPQWSQTDSIVRRFRAEARTASTIGHPNIVQVFDAGALPDRRLFLVMEHLAGRDLEAELIENTTVEPPRRACAIMRQIALALGAGHRAGIVHRDLKPSNIMLVPQAGEEAVKVLDFGIAANTGLIVAGAERITSPGSLMGTPEYMAPEQATNMPARPTFDVYAMGVMLFEMLTGDIPFSASNAFELLAFKLNRPAPSVETRRPGLPAALVRLIADCLATDSGERPPDGDAVAARLDTILQDMRRDSQSRHKSGPTSPGASSQLPLQATLTAPIPSAAASLTGPSRRPGPRSRRCAARPARPHRDDRARAAHRGGARHRGVLLRAGPETPPPAELAAVVPPAPVDTVPVPKDISKPPPAIAPPPSEPPVIEPPPSEPTPPVPEGATVKPTAKAGTRPGSDAHMSPRCQRVRTSAEEARRTQRWAILRDYTRQRECWASGAEARKLETKALMELGDFTGCMSVGKGLKDQEAQGWLKLCQKRVGAEPRLRPVRRRDPVRAGPRRARAAPGRRGEPVDLDAREHHHRRRRRSVVLRRDDRPREPGDRHQRAGPAGPVIHERLDEVGNRQLRRAEVLPGRGPRDPWIRITVRAVPGDEPGYVIGSGLYVGDDPVGDSVHETECRLCTEGEAVERGTSEIERLVPFVRDFAQAEREARLKAAAPPPELPKPEPPPPPKGLGGRGKAGVALLAVGGVGFFVGLGLAIKPPRPDPDMPLYSISTRPAGVATLSIGLAAVITGAVLLALDRKAAQRRVSWLPSIGRGAAGLSLAGSF